MHKRRAFTLVELLVVIAIIALLMSMLMPALGKVKKQAKLILCQSNLKQMGICFSMYANNWDGKFMHGWVPTNEPPNQHKAYWMEALRFCYGDDGDIRCCPMAMKPGTSVGGGWGGGVLPDATFYAWGIFPGDNIGEVYSTWPWVIVGDYGSYAMNSHVNDPKYGRVFQGHDPKWCWRSANVRGTAYIPLMTAGQWIDAWPDHINSPPEFQGEPWDNVDMVKRVCLNRHDGYVNMVFLDYTVRKVGLKELWRLKWHRMYDLTFALPPEFQDPKHWMFKFKDPE